MRSERLLQTAVAERQKDVQTPGRDVGAKGPYSPICRRQKTLNVPLDVKNRSGQGPG